MPEMWIVRVRGKEYGPVDFETLREWKKEGRVLPANEVRNVGVDLWTTADKIPYLFGPVQVAARSEAPTSRRSLRNILIESWRIYRKGFWQFLGLSALVVVPSICGQLSSVAVGSPVNMEIDARTLLAAMFNLCMLLLSLAALAGCAPGKGSVAGKVRYKGKELTAGAVQLETSAGVFVGNIGPDGSYVVKDVPTGTAKVGVSAMDDKYGEKLKELAGKSREGMKAGGGTPVAATSGVCSSQAHPRSLVRDRPLKEAACHVVAKARRDNVSPD